MAGNDYNWRMTGPRESNTGQPDWFHDYFEAEAIDGFVGDPAGNLAYAYLRCSSSGQVEEGRSGLPRQLQHVAEAARANHLKITWETVYFDDHTGFEFRHRPALSALRREIKNPKRISNVLIIEYLDRLSRNADWHQGFLLEEMNERNIKVIFWKSFSSRIERAVIGAISQEGMEQAKQRMAEGNIFKAKDGRVTARVSAYGYIFVDSTGRQGETAKRDTHYAPHPQEADVVRFIYTKVALEGHSLRALSVILQERFPPPKHMAHWEPMLIGLIIRNPVYKGEFVAHRYQYVKVLKEGLPGEPARPIQKKIQRPREEWIIVPVPALVSPELWEMANRTLAKNSQMSRRNAKAPYLLTGLVRCAKCGYSYIGRHKTKKGRSGQVWCLAFYRCSARANRAPHVVREIACTQGQVACHVLDEAVWSAICKLLLEPRLLLDVLENELEGGENVERTRQVRFLETEIREKDLEDAKLYRAYQADVFDEFEYATRRKLLKESRRNLEADLEELRDRVLSREELEERKSLILSLAQQMAATGLSLDAPFEVRQQVLKLLVDQIVLDAKEGWFRIEGVIRGKYPLPTSHVETIESIPVDTGSSRRPS